METPHAFQSMNTDFLVSGLSEPAALSVQLMVEEAAKKFSRFSPDSEISRINRLAGEWTSVSPLTYDLLSDALAAFYATDGLFNPFMGRNLETLGYDRSFETLLIAKWVPNVCDSLTPASEAPIADALPQLPLRSPLELREKARQIRLACEASIDLGGIAKGWVAQRAADGLIATGIRSGLVDAGGDVVLWGAEPEQGLWGIGIADPRGTGEDIADLWIEGLTAIATSSVVKRRWQMPGQAAAHHIVDPRTGASSASDLLQATILARDLAIAEQYAKCLIVLGSRRGIPWLAMKRSDLAFVAVRRDGMILQSDNLNLYAREWKVSSYAEWADSDC